MTMKTLLSILFLFTALSCNAQYHNVEGIRVVGRSDSTTISNVGQIQFDADDDKFRFNDGTGWFSFLKEGTSLPYWPLSGSATLTNNTDIVVPNDIYSWIGNAGQTQGIVSLPSATSPVVGLILDNSQVKLNPGDVTIESDGDLLIQSHTQGSGDLDISGFLTADISAGANNSFTRITGGGTSVKPGIHFGETATTIAIGVPRIHLGVTAHPNNILITNTNDTYGFSITLEGDNSSAEAFFRDHSASPKGLQYDADYSSTFSTRSLVDKGYVDGKFDGIQVPEGANKTMGIATLSSGTVTVNTTAVTANSRIFLTVNGGTLTNVGTPYVSARSAGTSFTITSTNASDASDVAWIIIEPAP
jgi:hypothetical protein